MSLGLLITSATVEAADSSAAFLWTLVACDYEAPLRQGYLSFLVPIGQSRKYKSSEASPNPLQLEEGAEMTGGWSWTGVGAPG